jgi:hypothetical protein
MTGMYSQKQTMIPVTKPDRKANKITNVAAQPLFLEDKKKNEKCSFAFSDDLIMFYVVNMVG